MASPESPGQVITEYIGCKDYEIKSYEPSWFDNVKGFFMSPVIQGLLIIIIIGGIYFEMANPRAWFSIRCRDNSGYPLLRSSLYGRVG